jgi:invasion protein IalB
MKRNFKYLFAFLLAFLPAAGQTEEISRGKVGAWEVRCQSSGGNQPEQCVLAQTVRSEDKAGVNMAMIITRPAGAPTMIMRIVAPPGVFLLNGVGMKIDQTDMGRLPFFRCSPAGCIADAPLDDKLLDDLRNGKIATVVIYLEPGEGLRHLVRLEGLKEALQKLR